MILLYPIIGILLGLQLFKALSWITAIGVAVIYTSLSSPLGKSLNGILLSMLIFNGYRAFIMVYHYLKLGPLARSNENIKTKES